MLSIQEAKNIPYEELDAETENYIYELFKAYVVRKQIADANKELSGIYSTTQKTSNPREFAQYFNQFNNAFVKANLINELHYDEIHTDMLKGMSEEKFSWYVTADYNSFERAIALICYSGRPSERIANRVSFPVMVAYANMQEELKNILKQSPKVDLYRAINDAAAVARLQFEVENGYKINDSVVYPERTDYKSIGKKAAPIWKSMLECYKRRLHDYDTMEVADFVYQNFIFTNKDRKKFNTIYKRAMSTAVHDLDIRRAASDVEVLKNADEGACAGELTQEAIKQIFQEIIEKNMETLFNEMLNDELFAEKKKPNDKPDGAVNTNEKPAVKKVQVCRVRNRPQFGEDEY